MKRGGNKYLPKVREEKSQLKDVSEMGGKVKGGEDVTIAWENGSSKSTKPGVMGSPSRMDQNSNDNRTSDALSLLYASPQTSTMGKSYLATPSGKSNTGTATPSSLFGAVMMRSNTPSNSKMGYPPILRMSSLDEDDSIPRRDGPSPLATSLEPRGILLPPSISSIRSPMRPSESNMNEHSNQNTKSPVPTRQKDNTLSTPRKDHIMWDPSTPQIPSGGQSSNSPFRKRVAFHASTPDRPLLASKSGTPTSLSRLHHSPGGFALLKVLDNCLSPHLQRLNGEEKVSDSVDSPSQQDNAPFEEWSSSCLRLPAFVIDMPTDTEAENRISNGNLLVGSSGVVDWSLKRMMHIECYPVGCLPGNAFEDTGYILNENRLKRIATKLLSNPEMLVEHYPYSENKGDDRREEEMVMAQWQAGLMYWQHPSIHPLPLNLLSAPTTAHSTRRHQNTSSRSHSGSNSFSQSSTFSLQRHTSLPIMDQRNKKSSRSISTSLFLDATSLQTKNMNESVRGVNAPLFQRISRSGVGCLGGLGTSVNDERELSSLQSLLIQREQEWQDCFQSMFFAWIDRMSEIEKGQQVREGEISRCCFYSISPGSTVLFRASTEDKGKITPIIAMSSSSLPSRSMLRSMGATLLIVEDHVGDADDDIESPRKYKVLSETLVDDWLTGSTSHVNETERSSALREDLEMLRQASTHGESIGADVSFSMSRKKANWATKLKKPRDFQPILLRGHDDCNIFFEYFLNTCGGKLSKMTKFQQQGLDKSVIQDYDVPLLLSRSLGPCVNASLRTLNLHKMRADVPSNKNQQDSKDGLQSSQHQSTIDIRGPILPCAVRDLTCATASFLSLAQKRVSQPNKSSPTSVSSVTKDKLPEPESQGDDSALGSHYFVSHLETHKGEEEDHNFITRSRLSSLKQLGSASSASFNGLVPLSSEACERQGVSKECNAGEYIDMIVWDITRPLNIAFKSEVGSNVISQNEL
jgi:hypothetical protein